MTLAEQQRALAAAVRGTPLATGLLDAASEERLRIYRHAYEARLTAALRDNFEVLAHAMGDAAFDALAHAYVRAAASPHASIRWYGDRLVPFMAERGDLVAHPAFVDLAAMDWALRGAFDAADAPTVARDALASLPASAWPALRLTLHPTVAIVDLQWQVEAAWQALRMALDDCGEPSLPAPQHGPHALLVWRRGLQPRWRSLADDEAALLQLARDGQPLARLCEAAAAQADEAAAALRAATAMQQWLDDGLIAAFQSDAEGSAGAAAAS